MSNFLRSIDRIGKEFKFTTNGEETFTTSFGGIITIIYYLGLVGLFGFFGKELILKQDPNFIQRVDISDKYPYSNISNSNFFFAIDIMDWYDTLIFNKSIFDVNLIYTKYIGANATNTFIESINCADSEAL